MKILERYILLENLKPFLVSLMVITFIMLLDYLLDLLNLIIEKHLDPLTVMQIFSLSLPYMLALSVPMSVLTASIMSFGRLGVDNELVAFKSCGINVYRLMKPLLIVAGALSIFMIYFNNTILPESNHRLKVMINSVSTRRPVSVLQPGVFTDLQEYTIYVRNRVGEEMQGIVIYDKAKRKYPDEIVAKHGRIVLGNNGNSLRAELFDGQMHSVDVKDPTVYQTRTFKKFVLNLPDLGFQQVETNTTRKNDRELSAAQLRSMMAKKKTDLSHLESEIGKLDSSYKSARQADAGQKMSRDTRRTLNQLNQKKERYRETLRDIRVYRVELNKKFALAFACLIFVLVGVPVGMMTRTSGVGMAFTVSSLVFLVYYVTLIGGEELADRGYVSPVLAMWIANIVIGTVGLILIASSVREQKIVDVNVAWTRLRRWIKL